MQALTGKAFVGLSVAALLLSACGSGNNTSTGASGSSGSPVKLTLMVGGLNKQIYLPNMLAKQLGYFAAENIDITLDDEASGQATEEEVVAGAVDAGSGAYNHTIDLQAKGKNMETICQFGVAPGEAEMVRANEASSITSAADLKGKNLGITELGSGTHTLTMALLGKAGVDPASAHYIGVGAGDTFIAAMQHNQIDAGMTTEPTITRLVQSGVGKVLIDLRDPKSTEAALGGDYPFIGIFAKNDWVNSHKDVAQRLVNVYTKTMKWMHSHTAAQIADKMPADYLLPSKDLYVTALQNQMGQFNTDCKMPSSGPQTVLNVLKSYVPSFKSENATIDLSKTYTNQFADNAS
ncbi:MAG TPA: ABC transporter substrate-binding protein [Candidatus Dormibacteraeota bacterium]